MAALNPLLRCFPCPPPLQFPLNHTTCQAVHLQAPFFAGHSLAKVLHICLVWFFWWTRCQARQDP
jgi:hypothetical protein